MGTCTGSTGTATNILQPSSPTGHEYLAPDGSRDSDAGAGVVGRCCCC
eukprot:SAG11_NODE_23191_length_393_cov_1.370748_2_plen_47_part_01